MVPPTLTNKEWVMLTSIVAKLFLMTARAMPPLPKDAGYLLTWFYNLLQEIASNDDKKIEKRPEMVRSAAA